MKRLLTLLFIVIALNGCQKTPTRLTDIGQMPDESLPQTVDTYTAKDMANFEKAMENLSTAPNYVLVSIVDKNTGKSWGVCMESMELLSAIMKEHDIQSPDAFEKAVEIIKQNNSKTFTFTKPEVLKYLKPVYAREFLKKIRSEFSYYSDEDMVKFFSDNRTRNMQDLCKQFDESHRVTQTAIAHILLERGILCGRGCLGGELYVDKR